MNYQDNSTPIKFTPGRDSSYSSNSDVGTKPTGDPKAAKDFKKLLGKNKDPKGETESDSQLVGALDEEEPSLADIEDGTEEKSLPMSLFNLSGGKTTGLAKKGEAKGKEKVDDSSLTASPYAPQKPKVALKTKGYDEDSADAAFAPVKDDANTKIGAQDKPNTRFSTEQGDLSSVNPLAAINTQPVESINTDTSKLVVSKIDIQSIIDQMVDKVMEMKQGGITDTVVTLRNPPLFAGANIVVTSFDSAKGEFNISFENLSQAAKNILDLPINQQSLMNTLSEKGYTVHIVNTTTLLESRPVIADAQPDSKREKEEGGRGEGRQQQQDKRGR